MISSRGCSGRDHPLGLPILGTKERIEAFRRNDLLQFLSDPLPGESSRDQRGRESANTIDSWIWSGNPSDRSPGHPCAKRPKPPWPSPGRAVLRKDLEQVHLIIGAPAPSAVSPERHAAFLLNAVLGGSMSSWLFQEIREKRGLAYAIYSYLTPYMDTGMFGIYAGTGSDKVREVLGLDPGGTGAVLRRTPDGKGTAVGQGTDQGEFSPRHGKHGQPDDGAGQERDLFRKAGDAGGDRRADRCGRAGGDPLTCRRDCSGPRP